MSRTDALKGVYVARFAAIVLCGVGVWIAAQRGAVIPAIVLGALLAAMLLCGRIQAHFWSQLLAGLHRLNQRDYAASKIHTERFLAQLRDRPWLRRLRWLGSSSYALDPEVMALNNLGAAELALGEFEAARGHLDQAIACDPLCPLPYRNMGALVLRTASAADAAPWFDKAVALGLRGDFSDRVVMSSQRRNAELSTTGAAGGARPSSPPPPEPPVTGAWIVYLLKDEATPVELAVTALEAVFGMTGAQAIRTVRRAQTSDRAACAGFDDAADAQGKAEQLQAYAQAHGHSLRCVAEPG